LFGVGVGVGGGFVIVPALVVVASLSDADRVSTPALTRAFAVLLIAVACYIAIRCRTAAALTDQRPAPCRPQHNKEGSR